MSHYLDINEFHHLDNVIYEGLNLFMPTFQNLPYSSDEDTLFDSMCFRLVNV